MMPKNMAALIDYRLKQANESIAEAEILLKNKASLRSVTNRVYYGMFYSALALLITKKIGSSKHSGVLAMFNKEFVKPKIFPTEMAKSFWKAFNMRQKGDYKEFEALEKADVKNILSKGKEFIKRIEKYTKR